MLVPSERQKQLLEQHTASYVRQLHDETVPGASQAYSYLADRGFTNETMHQYRFGYVGVPERGHEKARGFLSIPYITPTGVVSLRFRRGPGSNVKYKYFSPPGEKGRLYNTGAILTEAPHLGITEGEYDAVAASVAGIPTVGVPGAQAWKPEYVNTMLGFPEVFIFADNDSEADQTDGVGENFANNIMQDLTSEGLVAKVIVMPPGHDVNSYITEHGAEKFIQYVTGQEEEPYNDDPPF